MYTWPHYVYNSWRAVIPQLSGKSMYATQPHESSQVLRDLPQVQLMDKARVGPEIRTLARRVAVQTKPHRLTPDLTNPHIQHISERTKGSQDVVNQQQDSVFCPASIWAIQNTRSTTSVALLTLATFARKCVYIHIYTPYKLRQGTTHMYFVK